MWLVLSSWLPEVPRKGPLAQNAQSRQAPTPVGAGTGIAEGWDSGPASLWPKVG